MYVVPIAAPQPPALPLVGGTIILLPSPLIAIPYDIGQEFPTDPLRLLMAWSSGYWQVTGIYNGK